MKIKLSDIKSGFKDKFFDIQTNSIPNRGTSFKHNSIHCTLSSFAFQSTRYGLKGYLDATISHECVRCLDAFESKISLPLEVFLESNNIEESLESESENVIKFSNSMDEIDIGVFLADFIELEKPMNPLCKNDCLGLCVVCGVNKSVTSCDCKVDKGNEVWDKLKDLEIK
tara:strand:- start:1233 stop:1742 length:510 start_codon:yes stop_codon:yes gene_type:complete